jgi:hypothetical protein
MLALLFDGDPGSAVSLEVFEDVGVESNGTRVALQSKSSVSGKNPVSDRAEPFWKALLTWLNAINSGALDLSKTQFELYVFGEFDGAICSSFSDATDESTARQALKTAKSSLSSNGGKVPPHVASVLEHDDDILAELIVRFRYTHGSGDSQKDLEKLLLRHTVPSDLVDVVLKYMLGWVKQRSDSLLEKRLPAIIGVDEFRRELVSFTRSQAFSAVYANLAGPPAKEEIEGHRSKIYVRQLDLVEVEDERKIRAITAYLTASSNTTEWARRGLVHQTSLDEFEKQLVRLWENSRDQSEIVLADKDAIRRGRYVLLECTKVIIPLEGRAVPTDFVEGCFHTLADNVLIGWHPDFKILCKGWK